MEYKSSCDLESLNKEKYDINTISNFDINRNFGNLRMNLDEANKKDAMQQYIKIDVEEDVKINNRANIYKENL